MLKKLKLDEIQRKEEAYIIKLWNESKKLRQDWYDLDREDQENINEIIQEEEDNNDQEIDGDTKKVSSNKNEKDQEQNNGFGRFDDVDDILHNDRRHDKLKKEETRILYCPYCDWFRTSQEKYYTNHVMNKHPGKLLYPNRILLESMSLKPKGNPWEN